MAKYLFYGLKKKTEKRWAIYALTNIKAKRIKESGIYNITKSFKTFSDCFADAIVYNEIYYPKEKRR